MSSAASYSSATANYSLTITNGSKKGTRYRLASPKVTIGRSSENDISIATDSKCSRHHATIEFRQNSFEVTSMSQKNPVLIEGTEISSRALNNGDKIRIGETILLFEVEMSQASKALDQPIPPSYLEPVPYTGAPTNLEGQSKGLKKVKKKKSKKKKSPTFNIIVAAVILFFIWIMLSNSKPKEEEVNLATNSELDAKIEADVEIRKAKEREVQRSQKNTVQYRDAQGHFVKGFRDYEKARFSRAFDSFQTCLSLYPSHVLCQRYARLSEKRFNEVVQYNLILGRDHKDRNQFRACMNSLRTVMVMLKDKSNKTYQQAKASYDACSAQLGDRF